MSHKKLTKKLKKASSKEKLGIGLTINDLREKEFNGDSLNKEEKTALKNFDKFRISELNNQKTDLDFHKRYRELQVMANLGDYKEFLSEKYLNL